MDRGHSSMVCSHRSSLALTKNQCHKTSPVLPRHNPLLVSAWPRVVLMVEKNSDVTHITSPGEEAKGMGRW